MGACVSVHNEGGVDYKELRSLMLVMYCLANNNTKRSKARWVVCHEQANWNGLWETSELPSTTTKPNEDSGISVQHTAEESQDGCGRSS